MMQLFGLFEARRSLGKIFLKQISYAKGDDDDKSHDDHAPWDQLPDDLWSLIFQRLPLVDRVRSCLICKQWLSILRQTPLNQPVWVMLPPKDERDPSISVCDLCEGTILKLRLPSAVADMVGICKGWCAMITSGIIRKRIFLYDPISRVRIPLPLLSTVRPSSWKNVSITNHLALSCKDASRFVVAACFEKRRILALCRPEDKRWTVFEGLRGVGHDYYYSSIYFCDGILYALISTQNEDNAFYFQTHSIKLEGGHDVILKLIPLSVLGAVDKQTTRRDADPGDSHLVEDWASVPYVVQSNNELLIVKKVVDAFITRDEDDDDDDDDDEDEEEDEPLVLYFRTARFGVFKVKENDGKLHLTRLSSIDDQILFIDGLNSVSIPAVGGNLSKNCIYFIEDGSAYFQEGWRPTIISRESGVFYLDNGRIKRWFPSFDIIEGFRCVWFFPNIKIR